MNNGGRVVVVRGKPTSGSLAALIISGIGRIESGIRRWEAPWIATLSKVTVRGGELRPKFDLWLDRDRWIERLKQRASNASGGLSSGP
jgi:hypothetical protein